MKEDLHMLAFDFGASSGRAILGSFDGKQIHFEEVHRFSNEPVWMNGHFYWDILRLWHEVKVGLSKTLAQGIKISSIGIDTWGVDYGLVDKKGRLLANPHHYRDQRTIPVMNALIQRLGEDYLYKRSRWFGSPGNLGDHAIIQIRILIPPDPPTFLQQPKGIDIFQQ